MTFSQEFIQKIQDANNLVDLVRQFTELRSSGRQVMGRCPFPDHKEKTPSFSVSEEKQVFHCFGCQKSGNIFHFVEYYYGYGFREAITFLAQRAGIELPQEKERDNKEEAAKARKRQALLEVNRWALQFFKGELLKLPSDHKVKRYIALRNLDASMIDLFHIGYAPDEWEGLTHFLSQKGCSLSLAEEAGLIKARGGQRSGYYDIFKNRLMFPIFSQLGDCIGFGGRILDQGHPKYLNSPETLLFNKSKVLYGLHETGRFIRSEDQAIIVEGYMDLIALYRQGIKSVVAPLGTALTSEHVRLLKRMTPHLVILFDGDAAGQRAAERSLPLTLGAGALARGLTLPENMDPDEFIRNRGDEALKKLLTQSQDLFVLILERWMDGYRGEPVEKVKLADRLKEIFALMTDPRLTALYIHEASHRMGVEQKWLREALGMAPPSRSVAKGAPVAKVSKPIDTTIERGSEICITIKGASTHELLLLKLALSKETRWQKAIEVRDLMQHSGLKTAFTKAEELYRQDPLNFVKLTSRLTNFLDSPELLMGSLNGLSAKTFAASEDPQSFVEMSSNEISNTEDKILEDCINKVRSTSLKLEAQKIASEIRLNPDPEMLKKFMSLHKSRLSLNRKK